MNTARFYDGTNISSDTGVMVMIPAGPGPPPPATGVLEQIVPLRMRISTNTTSLLGMHLATLRWNDGKGAQEWNIAIAATLDNYAEQANEIWWDQHTDVTLQVSPLVAGGSIDVRLIYAY